MSDDGAPTNPEEEKNFYVDRAKTGRAGCKKCKVKIEAGALRLAKLAVNPFGSGKMKSWHHVECLMQVFAKQRATTAKIESVSDIGGWDNISGEDQEEILAHLPESVRMPKEASTAVPKVAATSGTTATASTAASTAASTTASTAASTTASASSPVKDDTFREFRRVCAEVAASPAYTDKTAIVKEFFTLGANKDGFRGDLLLWCRLLLPGAVRRVYNLQSKQLIKLFSRLLGPDEDEMLEDLEAGDVAETISKYFEASRRKLRPTKKSVLTLQDVDHFLEQLAQLTKEDEQVQHFKQIAAKCTTNDLKIIIRLVKHDLRMNAGPKHILDAVHPDAYQAFQTSRDLASVIQRAGRADESATAVAGAAAVEGGGQSAMNVTVKLLTPVLPMLAEACKSVEMAMRKCPNGMYSEIKYDGERVQVHKKGSEFKYFSRSLKPVLQHKIQHFCDYIPKAFPYGKDLIIDSEILMIDTKTGKPLPFGSLGKHKKTEFSDASVCLFVFDCIYYNGEALMDRPIKERKRILEDNMVEVPNHVVFSEMEEVHNRKDLEAMITKVIKLGLEGLVLKDIMSTYKPGKRHWLKVKKDYLFDGAMADSADLVVLGAWYGSGHKGGMMSVFLMGCHDPRRDRWCTVTKVHTGHDDNTLKQLQTELDMVKISKNQNKVPKWLKCAKTMVPDLVARDPKAQPVWEITGAEFTQHEVHTADGISVRFPRVTRIRSDKNWATATSLPELKALYVKSKDQTDFSLAGHSSEPVQEKVHGTRKRAARSEDKEDAPSRKKKLYEPKPLPDIFVGVKLTLPDIIDQEMAPDLERYFVAYGGELLDGNSAEEATHAIGDKSLVRGVGVDIAWLWDSIKLQDLQNVDNYTLSTHTEPAASGGPL